jgi:hypothetical protein
VACELEPAFEEPAIAHESEICENFSRQ